MITSFMIITIILNIIIIIIIMLSMLLSLHRWHDADLWTSAHGPITSTSTNSARSPSHCWEDCSSTSTSPDCSKNWGWVPSFKASVTNAITNCYKGRTNNFQTMEVRKDTGKTLREIRTNASYERQFRTNLPVFPLSSRISIVWKSFVRRS